MNDNFIPANPGAIHDTPDTRDYVAEDIMGAAPLPNEYEVLAGYPLKIENQNSSSSCVGQAFSKYAEVLGIINGSPVDLSAKFIYAQIHLPQGGAMIRDGAKLLTRSGDALESDVPSYPSTESDMTETSFLERPEVLQRALRYEPLSYAMVQSKSFEMVKRAVFENHGCVIGFDGDNAGWQNAIVKPPANVEWGHAVFLRGFKIIEGKQYLIIHNSWGEQAGDKGRFYVGEDYFAQPQYIFNPWTLVNKIIIPNTNIDEPLLEKLYNVIFHRNPDTAAQGYLGQSVDQFLTAIMASGEFIEYDKVNKAIKFLENWARNN